MLPKQDRQQMVQWVGKGVAPIINRVTPPMEVLLCKVPDGIKFEDYVPYNDRNSKVTRAFGLLLFFGWY